MNELQRYVDILFADYQPYPAANKLRIAMLNDLLLKKERLQMQGKTEIEASREVLASLHDSGAPVEGNILIYTERLFYANSLSLLLWLLAGLVLSVPMLILGQVWLSLLFLAAVLWATVRLFKCSRMANSEKVDFCAGDAYAADTRKYWLIWLIVSVVWLLGALLLKNVGAADSAYEIWAVIQAAGRYYPPVVLLVVPLWASGRAAAMLQCEVGAPERAAAKALSASNEKDSVSAVAEH